MLAGFPSPDRKTYVRLQGACPHVHLTLSRCHTQSRRKNCNFFKTFATKIKLNLENMIRFQQIDISIPYWYYPFPGNFLKPLTY